jgi:hypothetical protein
MPRWVGWILIALPSLSILGTWLLGRFPLFQFVAIFLFGISFWDWQRYFDRSRTMLAMIGLSAGMIVGGTVASLVSHPPLEAFQLQSIAVISWIALTIALVQLYRNGQTVLTLVRGWLYAIAILAGITVYQRVTRDLPALNGPFPSPGYLAGAMIAGIFLMPIGFALEKDHRLRWAYPVIAGVATWVVWTTHRSVGFSICLAVLVLWVATYRWRVAALLVAVGAAVVIVRWSAIPFRWAEVGMEPPLPPSQHGQLIETAWGLLQNSYFLGTGPGGLLARWPYGAEYGGPYFALIELAAQYGFAIAVQITLALIGVLVWGVARLWQTRRTPLWDASRAPAFWVAVGVVLLPASTSLQASWLDFPLSALAVATMALLARHIESPQGRPLLWSARPGAGEEAGRPPQHGDALEAQEGDDRDAPDVVSPTALPDGTHPTDGSEEGEPHDHATRERDDPDLAREREDVGADEGALRDLPYRE